MKIYCGIVEHVENFLKGNDKTPVIYIIEVIRTNAIFIILFVLLIKYSIFQIVSFWLALLTGY